MTDREKLIELLGADTCTENDCCDDCVYHENEEACVQYLKAKMADHLIANGVTFATDNNVGSKWISVKDRLPEKYGEHILVCYTDGWICDQFTPVDDGVTHWMPLPQLPEGE